MAAEYDGADALMVAITGEPLPGAARADAEFMAGHRAALDDVALLREQLTLIGEALAVPPAGTPSSVVTPSHHPAPRPAGPVRRRRALRIALGSLAAVVALMTVVGLGRLVTQNGERTPLSPRARARPTPRAAPGRRTGGRATGPRRPIRSSPWPATGSSSRGSSPGWSRSTRKGPGSC
ncbi:hypothetical protein ACFQ0G_32605 [Streptomyces chiangmaiensis]